MSMGSPVDMEAFVDAQSVMLGLTITAAQRPGVVRYMQLVAGMAPRVMDFALTPADESGNVFVPVSAPVPAAMPEDKA
jgi:Protein of unknown function (DUF4089)